MPNHFKVQVFLLTAGFQNMDWTWDLSGHPPNTLSLVLRATHGEKQNHRVDSKATCQSCQVVQLQGAPVTYTIMQQVTAKA